MPFDGRLPIEPEVKLAIENARHYLAVGGWVRWQPEHGGRFCAWAAIRQATQGWDENPVYQKALERVVAELPPIPEPVLARGNMSPMGKLQHWNDQPERTAEEVLELFDRTLGKVRDS